MLHTVESCAHNNFYTQFYQDHNLDFISFYIDLMMEILFIHIILDLVVSLRMEKSDSLYSGNKNTRDRINIICG